METDDENHELLHITDELYKAGMDYVHPSGEKVAGRRDSARMFVPEQREPTEES